MSSRCKCGLPDDAFFTLAELCKHLKLDYKIVMPWFDGRPDIIQNKRPYVPGVRSRTLWRIPHNVAERVIEAHKGQGNRAAEFQQTRHEQAVSA